MAQMAQRISFEKAMEPLLLFKVELLLTKVTDLGTEIDDYSTDPQLKNQRDIYKANGPDKSCVSYQNHKAKIEEFESGLDGILRNHNKLMEDTKPHLKPYTALTSIAFDNTQQVRQFIARCKDIRRGFTNIAYKYNVINSVLSDLMIQEELGSGNVDPGDVEYRL